MYVVGFVIPVPAEKLVAYKQWAENSAGIMRDYGCLEIVECWEDRVPDGKLTDFRRAVAAGSGERIVFTWQVWPDKQSLDDAEANIPNDERFEGFGDPPFDSRRLIFGCFAPIFSMKRSG